MADEENTVAPKTQVTAAMRKAALAVLEQANTEAEVVSEIKVELTGFGQRAANAPKSATITRVDR